MGKLGNRVCAQCPHLCPYSKYHLTYYKQISWGGLPVFLDVPRYLHTCPRTRQALLAGTSSLAGEARQATHRACRPPAHRDFFGFPFRAGRAPPPAACAPAVRLGFSSSAPAQSACRVTTLRCTARPLTQDAPQVHASCPYDVGITACFSIVLALFWFLACCLFPARARPRRGLLGGSSHSIGLDVASLLTASNITYIAKSANNSARMGKAVGRGEKVYRLARGLETA